MKQSASVPALLEGVLCRSVGVLLAEAHAVGAGALSRDLAGEEVATLTTVVVHGCQNGGDLTWLLVHGPVLFDPEDT